MDEVSRLKTEGNQYFMGQNWNEALECYSKAIKLFPSKGDHRNELAILHKNRAAAHLKLGHDEAAITDCLASLELVPNDPKALYRLVQALENEQRFEEAYKHAITLFKADPSNASIQPVLRRLHPLVEQRATMRTQTSYKVNQMSDLAFDVNTAPEKRSSALQNLLVLARESGSHMDVDVIVPKLKSLIKTQTQGSAETGTMAVRVISELVHSNAQRAKHIVADILGVNWLIECLDSTDETRVTAVQYLIQNTLNAYSGMDSIRTDSKPNKDLCEENKQYIDSILGLLICSVNSRIISALARDAIIGLLIRNIHHTALNWAEQLMQMGGVEKLLDCASEVPEYHYESAMNVTNSTSTVAALCLSRVYENMYYDRIREEFLERVQQFLRDKLLAPDVESKVRVCVAITALLRGPMDVGNTVIGKTGILEMVLAMTTTDDVLQQRIACECIIAASSKANKAAAIISQGADILKRLYKTSPDYGVKVRSLVGLCKLASSAGTDVSMQPFDEGSTVKLADACRKFMLVGKQQSDRDQGSMNDLRRWAVEGLSYLTLDAEVKEMLIGDLDTLRALLEFAKKLDESCVFAIVNTLVNLCNAYDKQEVLPEMLELAKFAKQHIPVSSKLDGDDYVRKRILVLGRNNVACSLVALSATVSSGCRELIGRIFNALASMDELRGLLVQQGAVKALLKMAQDESANTPKGRRQAAQALARIAISIDPNVAFPGQRSLEVIRPLLNLLHPDFSGLENFEALLGLCNLAQMSETARQRILKEQGLGKIENYMYEDHTQLTRAAVQCVTNMVMSPDVVKIYEGNNDKIKFLVAMLLSEDLDTMKAAGGALCILTSDSEDCCRKILQSKNWVDALKYTLTRPEPEFRFRGVCICQNIAEKSNELAKELVDTELMDILTILSNMTVVPSDVEDVDTFRKVTEVANDVLKAVEGWGLVKNADTADDI